MRQSFIVQSSLIEDDDVGVLLEAIRKSKKGFRKEDASRRDFLSYRQLKFIRPKYYKTTPEVIIKKLSSGVGKMSLKNVAMYLMRENDYQEGEDKVTLINSDGKEIRLPDLEDELNEFSKSFFSNQDPLMDDEKHRLALKIDKEISYLEMKQKEDPDQLNETEKRTLRGYKNGIGNDISIWRYGTKVIDQNGNEFQLKEEISSERWNVFIEDENKTRVLNKEDLTPIETIEGIQIHTSKKTTKAHERAYDDPNHRVDIVGAKIQRHSLQADFDHMLLSPGGKFHTSQARRATIEFMNKNYRDRGFDYLLAEHKDTDNTHYHVVINKRNFLDKNITIRHNPIENYVSRQEYSFTLESFGIDRSVTRKIDRTDYFDIAREQLDKGLRTKEYFFDRREQDLERGQDHASNIILDAYNVHQRLNEIQDKIDEKYKDKLSRSQYKKISKGLSEAHAEVKSFTVENFEEFQLGISNWLKGINQQTADFWDEEMTLQKSISFSKKEQKRRINATFEAQKKAQERVENTFIALEEYKDSFPDTWQGFIKDWQDAAIKVWVAHEQLLYRAHKAYKKEEYEVRVNSIREVRDYLLSSGQKAQTLARLQSDITKERIHKESKEKKDRDL